MCCGRKVKTAFRSAAPRVVNQQPASPGSGPAFEYIGRTALTVVGPLTGMRYRFDRPGARLQVHPRDRQALVGIPALRLVS
jgi:hypothetical protein